LVIHGLQVELSAGLLRYGILLGRNGGDWCFRLGVDWLGDGGAQLSFRNRFRGGL
jgi:hypothetical protein